ncbi:hypothetical protein BEP19_16440 [Ammoniphilus oxalaticus]|uniref:Nucleotidase n=2 Tax=Ammoniphilus oxalaticus TaxID=66863 RepID=A0A419SR19_9BACL|nr:hypothetical protein BEP19_16440 [Ammoniphilus oxalaticus]
MGIDIDGTLTEFDSFIPYFNELLGKQVKPEEIVQYDLHEIFEMDYDDFSKLFDEHSAPVYEQSHPRSCAQEELKWIDDHYNIVYITARLEEFEELTEKWIKEHGFPNSPIVCTGTHNKIPAIKEYHVNYMVEDRLENALHIWEELSVPVFLIDTPYNQATLPSGVHRVTNWREVTNFLKENGGDA